MVEVDRWHASPQRAEAATGNPATGEVRVPLALFRLDQPRGSVDLVLSRVEAAELYSALGRLLLSHPLHSCAGR
ncbi:hypothetical protein VR41_01955 [Streptomyces sp. NRRL B-1568]|nr:hypothetical protein VR41_01955 [Streptomyces sp. NRRL B-1568]